MPDDSVSFLPASDQKPPPLRTETIGVLFLVAPFLYGPGSSLLSVLDRERNASSWKWTAFGLALTLGNSIVVGALAVLVPARLLDASKAWTTGAKIYLGARLVEATLLAAGAVALAVRRTQMTNATSSSGGAHAYQEFNFLLYQTAMLALGLGSLPFCRFLLQHRDFPGWLAAWGCIGYLLLAVGAGYGLAVAGGEKTSSAEKSQVGLWLSVPGGLFELVLGVRWGVLGRVH